MVKADPSLTLLQPKAQDLLVWFDQNGRALPWRHRDFPKDPYPIWLSEIMLQQTTVATVGHYFERFISKWPRVDDLAHASIDEVLQEWAGLGYYSRAHNLHKCARQVVEAYGGCFPETVEALLKLPGIGPYTANAISAIAFNQPSTIVDGNVERVISRLYCIEEALPKAKPVIRMLAEQLTPHKRPGHYAEAIMDLGATICKPKKPLCGLCPWQNQCQAHLKGREEDYPRKLPKTERPSRIGHFFWVQQGGKVLIRQRSDQGMLKGLWELPSTPWDHKGRYEGFKPDSVQDYFPVESENWQKLDASLVHIFTHFRLEMQVYRTHLEQACKPPEGFVWAEISDLKNYAFGTVMQKMIKACLKDRLVSQSSSQ